MPGFALANAPNKLVHNVLSAATVTDAGSTSSAIRPYGAKAVILVVHSTSGDTDTFDATPFLDMSYRVTGDSTERTGVTSPGEAALVIDQDGLVSRQGAEGGVIYILPDFAGSPNGDMRIWLAEFKITIHAAAGLTISNVNMDAIILYD